MVGRVAADPAHADDVILEDLRGGVGEISRWPTDEELVEYLNTHDAYANIAQPRLVMVLAAVERSLYSSKTEALNLPGSLSLEHVLPQNWTDHWPLPADLTPEQEDEARSAREDRIHRLGNLTLTTLPLNAALSNGPWSVKQVELNRESRLLLNARLIEHYAAGFDETAIDDRTIELAERICSIWPGPDSPVWEPLVRNGEPSTTGIAGAPARDE